MPELSGLDARELWSNGTEINWVHVSLSASIASAAAAAATVNLTRPAEISCVDDVANHKESSVMNSYEYESNFIESVVSIEFAFWK